MLRLISIAFLLLSLAANANRLNSASIDLIKEASESICGKYLYKGNENSAAGNVEVTAELNSLIKKLLPMNAAEWLDLIRTLILDFCGKI